MELRSAVRKTSWGRGFRANSNEYVLDAMGERVEALAREDDQIRTTLHDQQKRVLSRSGQGDAGTRKLGFFWSCDTRVVSSDELLREMRGLPADPLGGERLTQKIPTLIDKKITPQEILDSTNLAKK